MDAPLWVRIVLRIDSALRRAVQVAAGVRDELLWSWLPAGGRRRVTVAIYSAETSYAPGGALFERGLHDWEVQLLTHLNLVPGGRVLIGGAGGGRELRAIAERGYRVTAFEPSERLAQAARGIARADVRVLVGAYEDLAAAVHGDGPLATLCDDAPYACVLLGWRSLSHVVDADDRDRLFRSLAVLAPGAPVVASFVPRRVASAAGRRWLRRAFAAARAPSAAPEGAMFQPHTGFMVQLDREDIARSASAGGYRIALFATDPDGHALLVPGGDVSE